ncbi:hypothetical protein [Piscinibacter koreensis]|uniref:CopL family metal-binding regulatory protein n=1 Tax=Piscinibacter koreensis TaxID=2742824 RepID=A0A7Y6NSF9_9BURK|nr:hypothetical protein [Schlegelella koreensis]NUZ08469.1 hypothetical protein [Schlegelella koreensis]
MHTLFRNALFWLLMLALPLQGNMVAGGFAFASGSLPQPQSTVRTGHDMASHASVAHHEHEAHDQQQFSDDCEGMPGCTNGQHTAGKCMLSAHCAVVAVPSQPLPLVLAAVTPTLPVALQHARRLAFCTGAPERPPRSLA